RPERMALLAWAGSAALAALGGAVVAPITFATYSMGLDLGLKGFVAAVAGGLTNPAAAVIGGLLLGVLESVGAGLHSGLQDVIAFAVLLVVLIVRQVGILGLRGRFGPRPRPAGVRGPRSWCPRLSPKLPSTSPGSRGTSCSR